VKPGFSDLNNAHHYFLQEYIHVHRQPSPALQTRAFEISGESFCREGESGIAMAELASVAEQIRDVVKNGVQLAIVCGGGNILRGKQFADISQQIVPSTAHYMGMLATVINGLALQDASRKRRRTNSPAKRDSHGRRC
jgi:uridylate kinase